MPDELVDDIRTLFEQELNIAVPAPDTDLIAAGLLDSLVFVDLIMKLEQLCDVEIPVAELDLETFRSLHEIAATVSALKADRDAPQHSAA